MRIMTEWHTHAKWRNRKITKYFPFLHNFYCAPLFFALRQILKSKLGTFSTVNIPYTVGYFSRPWITILNNGTRDDDELLRWKSFKSAKKDISSFRVTSFGHYAIYRLPMKIIFLLEYSHCISSWSQAWNAPHLRPTKSFIIKANPIYLIIRCLSLLFQYKTRSQILFTPFNLRGKS